MSAYLFIFMILSALAIVVVIIAVLIKHFSEIFFEKLKSLKPRIVVYLPNKKKKK